MKKILTIAMSAALALSCVACGGSASTAASTAESTAASTAESVAASTAESAAASTAEEGTLPTVDLANAKVGVCIYKFDDNFMTLYREALQKDLEAAGIPAANITIVDGKNDQATQTEQIDTFISQGVNVLVLNLVQSTAASSVLDKAKAANIPVVFINREPDAAVLTSWADCCYVGADARQSGTFQGEIIAETDTKGDINGDGTVKYVMIMGDPENVDAQYRTEFSVKALTDAGIATEELFNQRGDWDQAKGQELAATALSQYGTDVDVIFCNNDAMALGAAQAITAAGRTVGTDIYLVGVDALEEAVGLVTTGGMTGTVLNDANGQAQTAADCVANYLAGKTNMDDGDQNYTVDYVKVTKDNAATVLG